MTTHYPWYEVVEGDGLEQGDLLKACPVLVPVREAPLTTNGDTIIADQEVLVVSL